MKTKTQTETEMALGEGVVVWVRVGAVWVWVREKAEQVLNKICMLHCSSSCARQQISPVLFGGLELNWISRLRRLVGTNGSDLQEEEVLAFTVNCTELLLECGSVLAVRRGTIRETKTNPIYTHSVHAGDLADQEGGATQLDGCVVRHQLLRKKKRGRGRKHTRQKVKSSL